MPPLLIFGRAVLRSQDEVVISSCYGSDSAAQVDARNLYTTRLSTLECEVEICHLTKARLIMFAILQTLKV